ncbi:MAG: methylated-DNA--[protein]-cysteine S-methyltransferase [Acholeplasmataceae bacterium]|nr:methylated-DNA--[protein]-cysteine S-methyltransferase [Acholeplasmataceae bacterium]
MKEYIVLTRLGKMAFEVDRDQIVKLSFTDRPQTSALFPVCVNMAVKEIDQYLNREITVFSISYRLNARGFQLQVLRALLEIGYGQLITYKELAIKAGFPLSWRATAMACKHNPLPLIIPCHRVVRSDGTIGGYAGGTAIKHQLIELEKR